MSGEIKVEVIVEQVLMPSRADEYQAEIEAREDDLIDAWDDDISFREFDPLNQSPFDQDEMENLPERLAAQITAEAEPSEECRGAIVVVTIEDFEAKVSEITPKSKWGRRGQHNHRTFKPIVLGSWKRYTSPFKKPAGIAKMTFEKLAGHFEQKGIEIERIPIQKMPGAVLKKLAKGKYPYLESDSALADQLEASIEQKSHMGEKAIVLPVRGQKFRVSASNGHGVEEPVIEATSQGEALEQALAKYSHVNYVIQIEE